MFGRSKKHLTYQQGHVDGSQVGRAHGKAVGRATFAAEVVLLIEAREREAPSSPKQFGIADEYANYILDELKSAVIKLIIEG
jgi:hypothetical protein